MATTKHLGPKRRKGALKSLDMGKALAQKPYEKQLAALQEKLRLIQQAYMQTGDAAVILFEGWDTAGKGGTIRRITSAMDARNLKVWPVSAPRAYYKERTRKDATSAFDTFIDMYGVKYDKAVACLTKDRNVLLTVYDFPAEHWKHLRTTHPIESTFATVRHRTVRAKGCLSNKTALAMIFKLTEAAQKSWRRLDRRNQLPKLITGVKFNDGIKAQAQDAQTAAA